MDGPASCGDEMALDGSHHHRLEASVVPGLQKDHSADSRHTVCCCNLADALVAHTAEDRPPYLEPARKSPGLEEVAAAFACCAAVVAETGCQVPRMNIALQNESRLMEERCCMVLA